MAELLKNIYSKEFIQRLSKELAIHIANFDQTLFIQNIINDDWDSLELKERMRHISKTLNRFLPGDYSDHISILEKVAPLFKGLQGIVFPDYVEVYGLDDYELSVKAMEKFTPYSSSEFAVRPFIKKHPEKMMQQMLLWAGHSNPHVRRLASEGSRPRLPWAMAIPFLKKDPSPILPILEKLKKDDSEYVRRSVANNLNDISKDHPEIVLQIADRWSSTKTETQWIIRHACRGLIKKGNLRALELFGLKPVKDVSIKDMQILTPQVNIGNRLGFNFTIEVKQAQKIRIEYVIHYVKANGSRSPKVFKLVEKVFEPGSLSFSKQHSFQQMTTRKHYEGVHQVSIHLNGVEFEKLSFDVLGSFT